MEIVPFWGAILFQSFGRIKKFAMKKIFFIIILSFLNKSFGQIVAVKQNDVAIVSQIPKERTYLHVNTSLFFTGEYLYYSLYCLDAETSVPSTISKIAYVELVSEEGVVIFKQKLKLKNGKSSGDYFIPVTVPSGNYKIIGYTKWMINWGKFFEKDISIINPYLENQKTILDDSETIEESPFVITNSENKDGLSINLNEKTGTRSKVIVKIKNRALKKGNFSLSISHQSQIKNNSKSEIHSVLKNNFDAHIFANKRIHLPELRGELISGKVIPKDSDISLENVKVSLSIPNGDSYILKLATTNEMGEFYFNIDESYNTSTGIFQVVGQEKENYDISLDSNLFLDYSKLKFNRFYINESMKNLISERSIHNQIENGYFDVKPDSIIISPPVFSFNHDDMIVYSLDDYTRFKTIKETLVEIVNNVWAEKRDGKYVFQVRTFATSHDYYNLPDLKPLVLIDGILMQDHDPLMQFDARKVKSINVIRNKYVYGHNIYQGAIIIQTIDGNYKLANMQKYIVNSELFAPHVSKNHFKQIYDIENKTVTNHIPDYRYQLFWEPYFFIEEDEKEFSFYTSDVTGTFVISLEGFLDDGKPVSISKTFEVK